VLCYFCFLLLKRNEVDLQPGKALGSELLPLNPSSIIAWFVNPNSIKGGRWADMHNGDAGENPNNYQSRLVLLEEQTSEPGCCEIVNTFKYLAKIVIFPTAVHSHRRSPEKRQSPLSSSSSASVPLDRPCQQHYMQVFPFPPKVNSVATVVGCTHAFKTARWILRASGKILYLCCGQFVLQRVQSNTTISYCLIV
jgi:hypothetical protein